MIQQSSLIIFYLFSFLFFTGSIASHETAKEKVSIPLLFDLAAEQSFTVFKEQFERYIRIKKQKKRPLDGLKLAFTKCCYPVKDSFSNLKLSLLTAACSGLDAPAKLEYLLQKYKELFTEKLDTTEVATRTKYVEKKEYFLSLTYFVSLLNLDTLEAYEALFTIIAQARATEILSYDKDFECGKTTVDENEKKSQHSFFESFLYNDYIQQHPLLDTFLEAHMKQGIFITDNKRIDKLLSQT